MVALTARTAAAVGCIQQSIGTGAIPSCTTCFVVHVSLPVFETHQSSGHLFTREKPKLGSQMQSLSDIQLRATKIMKHQKGDFFLRAKNSFGYCRCWFLLVVA